jgi:hypothetical protein
MVRGDKPSISSIFIHMSPGCPPASAVDGPMQLFRLCASPVSTAADWQTADEKNTFRNMDPCLRKSLSSYSDRLGVDHVRRRVKHFNNHNICMGIVPPGAGVHMATPSKYEKSHCSWWPSRKIQRHSFFSVVP